jgi:glycosyltransferase involved in cell wall biosynthesis
MALRFSIVLPNFNSGEVLERAVRSLISQNYPNLQLIVADAGSDDSSSGIIESYKEHFDIIIREKDKGQADGLNRGFTRADGDVFGWLCADDELLPGALLHVAELFENHPETDVVTGGCERIYEDDSTEMTFPYPDTWERIGVQNVIEQPSTFWRAQLHRRIGTLDLDYQLGFDWDLWARMGKAGARLATTDRVLSRYYFSGDNKCSKAGNLFAEEAFRILKKYGPLSGCLAYVYRFLYYHFDLRGCFDKPPTSTALRYFLYRLTCAFLKRIIGMKYLWMYNWHFASCQERGLKWHS